MARRPFLFNEWIGCPLRGAREGQEEAIQLTLLQRRFVLIHDLPV